MNKRSSPFSIFNKIGLKQRFYIGPLGLLIILAILSSVFVYVGNAHKKFWQDVNYHHQEIGKATEQTIEQFNRLQENLLQTVLSAEIGASEEDIYDNGIKIIDELDQTRDHLNNLLVDVEGIIYEIVDNDRDIYEQELTQLSLAIIDMNEAFSEYNIVVRSAVEIASVDLNKAASLSLSTVNGHIKVNKALLSVRSIVFSSIQTSMDFQLNKYNKLYTNVWLGVLLFTGLLFYISFRVSKHTITALDYIHKSLLHTANIVSGQKPMDDAKQTSSIEQVESAVDTFSKVVVELEQQRQQIQLEQQKALAASQAKSAFLSSMSHEFNTPLNFILGYTQVLEKTKLDDEQKECLQSISEGGKILLTMVEKILILTDLDKHELQSTIAGHEVQVILSNALDSTSKVAELMSVKMKCSIMLNCPKINVDPHLVNEVLLAILNNAIIYNHNNGRVDINVSSEDDSSVRITIADDGPGIEKVDFDLIFQPFERLSQSNSTIAGAGVGLTIAKNLTEIMNGTIGFSSEVGVGSTFWVEFPISR
ncbi:hypothetical protein A9Q79_03290 [Methylophaga sp. 42_25_T18]|nr:hypothetical protein A9Q79_03290 [Methylophaga sp. 42_25_T18]OUR88097.1 hypothetical protein A9Q92_03405 [Methylophaga sp. 42_8_T64]